MSETDPMHDETMAAEQAAADPADRNPLALVAAAVGAVVLAALVWFFLVTPLLLGDDAGSVDDQPPAATDAPDREPSSTPDSPDGEMTDDPQATGELEELPLVTFEVFLARDPFEPVIPEAQPTADNGAADDTTTPPPATDGSDGEEPPADGSPSAPGTGTPDPDPGTGTVSPTPSDPPSDDDTLTDDGRILRLVEVTEREGQRIAVVQVDTTLFEVREGDRFSGNLVVQSIGANEVVLIHGDDVFRLRDGDRVLK